MKKFILFFPLFFVGLSLFAQKSYINVAAADLAYEYGQYIYLTGNVPSDMKKYYMKVSIGDILNTLSEKGYVVEFMCNLSSGSSSPRGVNYLLSKNDSGSANAIQRVRADIDEEVTEVARYNLQGMPVTESEKGIQIIVYSNYTTKTIIKE